VASVEATPAGQAQAKVCSRRLTIGSSSPSVVVLKAEDPATVAPATRIAKTTKAAVANHPAKIGE
jgi:hypothetical protein